MMALALALALLVSPSMPLDSVFGTANGIQEGLKEPMCKLARVGGPLCKASSNDRVELQQHMQNVPTTGVQELYDRMDSTSRTKQREIDAQAQLASLASGMSSIFVVAQTKLNAVHKRLQQILPVWDKYPTVAQFREASELSQYNTQFVEPYSSNTPPLNPCGAPAANSTTQTTYPAEWQCGPNPSLPGWPEIQKFYRDDLPGFEGMMRNAQGIYDKSKSYTNGLYPRRDSCTSCPSTSVCSTCEDECCNYAELGDQSQGPLNISAPATSYVLPDGRDLYTSETYKHDASVRKDVYSTITSVDLLFQDAWRTKTTEATGSMYVGTVNGVSAVFPGWPLNGAFDARTRPWFNQAIAVPRLVVIAISNEYSMSHHRDFVTRIVTEVINMFTSFDLITVLGIGRAELPTCYPGGLISATDTNKTMLKEFVENLQYAGKTVYSTAIRQYEAIVRRTAGYEQNFKSNLIILHPGDIGTKVVTETKQLRASASGMGFHVHSLSVGAVDSSDLACAGGGVSIGFDNVLNDMEKHLINDKLDKLRIFFGKDVKDGSFFVSTPYLDISTNLTTMTMTTAVYDPGTSEIWGCIAEDLRVEAIFVKLKLATPSEGSSAYIVYNTASKLNLVGYVLSHSQAEVSAIIKEYKAANNDVIHITKVEPAEFVSSGVYDQVISDSVGISYRTIAVKQRYSRGNITEAGFTMVPQYNTYYWQPVIDAQGQNIGLTVVMVFSDTLANTTTKIYETVLTSMQYDRESGVDDSCSTGAANVTCNTTAGASCPTREVTYNEAYDLDPFDFASNEPCFRRSNNLFALLGTNPPQNCTSTSCSCKSSCRFSTCPCSTSCGVQDHYSGVVTPSETCYGAQTQALETVYRYIPSRVVSSSAYHLQSDAASFTCDRVGRLVRNSTVVLGSLAYKNPGQLPADVANYSSHASNISNFLNQYPSTSAAGALVLPGGGIFDYALADTQLTSVLDPILATDFNYNSTTGLRTNQDYVQIYYTTHNGVMRWFPGIDLSAGNWLNYDFRSRPWWKTLKAHFMMARQSPVGLAGTLNDIVISGPYQDYGDSKLVVTLSSSIILKENVTAIYPSEISEIDKQVGTASIDYDYATFREIVYSAAKRNGINCNSSNQDGHQTRCYVFDENAWVVVHPDYDKDFGGYSCNSSGSLQGTESTFQRYYLGKWEPTLLQYLLDHGFVTQTAYTSSADTAHYQANYAKFSESKARGTLSGEIDADFSVRHIPQSNTFLVVMKHWRSSATHFDCGLLSSTCPNVVTPYLNVESGQICDPPERLYLYTTSSLIQGGVPIVSTLTNSAECNTDTSDNTMIFVAMGCGVAALALIGLIAYGVIQQWNGEDKQHED